MFNILLTLIISFFTLNLWATPTAEQPDRNILEYNLENDVGLKGYDPVSYFKKHGGVAQKGSELFSGYYGGVTYYFTSKANKDIFFSNPTRYEPTYGGWCAWAMANDGYADINPVLFTQNGQRMHFFISAGAKANFDNDLDFHENNADTFWKSETGEKPRI